LRPPKYQQKISCKAYPFGQNLWALIEEVGQNMP
jgi:hypothetical protein